MRSSYLFAASSYARSTHRYCCQVRNFSSSSGDKAERRPNAQLKQLLPTLFVTGAVAGPLIDGIHSRVSLQVYDSLPFNVEAIGLHTSLWVPPLLALFYAVLGSLQVVTDKAVGRSDPEESDFKESWWFVFSGFLLVAAGTELSAYMYSQGFPFYQIHLALSLATFGIWFLLDGSLEGILLGILSGASGLLAEVPLHSWFGLWHYPRADVFDVLVSWTFWCYFFYTPAIGNLARKLWRSPS